MGEKFDSPNLWCEEKKQTGIVECNNINTCINSDILGS